MANTSLYEHSPYQLVSVYLPKQKDGSCTEYHRTSDWITTMEYHPSCHAGDRPFVDIFFTTGEILRLYDFIKLRFVDTSTNDDN